MKERTLIRATSIVGEQAPVANFSAKFQSTLGFSDDQVKSLQEKSEACGYVASHFH